MTLCHTYWGAAKCAGLYVTGSIVVSCDGLCRSKSICSCVVWRQSLCVIVDLNSAVCSVSSSCISRFVLRNTSYRSSYFCEFLRCFANRGIIIFLLARLPFTVAISTIVSLYLTSKWGSILSLFFASSSSAISRMHRIGESGEY